MSSSLTLRLGDSFEPVEPCKVAEHHPSGQTQMSHDATAEAWTQLVSPVSEIVNDADRLPVQVVVYLNVSILWAMG